MLVGVVGKPSVGKSTFFKAATLAEVEIASYPFTTVRPNHGTGYVKVECADKHFNVQCNPRFGYCIDHIRFVPIDLLDVAGLVPGAHEGKGMGNQFLDDLRQADVLIHVVDIAGTTNEKGEPVNPGEYDPANDIKFLEEELDYWYLSILKKGWEKFAKEVQQLNKELWTINLQAGIIYKTLTEEEKNKATDTWDILLYQADTNNLKRIHKFVSEAIQTLVTFN